MTVVKEFWEGILVRSEDWSELSDPSGIDSSSI